MSLQILRAFQCSEHFSKTRVSHYRHFVTTFEVSVVQKINRNYGCNKLCDNYYYRLMTRGVKYRTKYIFPFVTKVGEPRSVYVIDLLANCDYLFEPMLFMIFINFCQVFHSIPTTLNVPSYTGNCNLPFFFYFYTTYESTHAICGDMS